MLSLDTYSILQTQQMVNLTMINVQTIPAYIIVIKGNDASEFYYNKVISVWNSIGIFPTRFDAITPETLPKYPLKFTKNKSNKYKKIGGKSFTPTEKAVWYSHFLLWKKSVELNQRILVLEHDCVPVDPSKLIFDETHHFRSFDMGALGCYMIEPSFALMVTRHLENNLWISSGPLGQLVTISYDIERKFSKRKWEFIEGVDRQRYDPGCTQILHSKYKTTIDHYKGTEVEDISDTYHKFEYYINVNDDDVLTLEFLKAKRPKFWNDKHA